MKGRVQVEEEAGEYAFFYFVFLFLDIKFRSLQKDLSQNAWLYM